MKEPSTWTQEVVKEIQEMQKLGIVRANEQVEYAMEHAEEYEDSCMRVSDCASLICELDTEDLKWNDFVPRESLSPIIARKSNQGDDMLKVKNVKINWQMSDETMCFSASLHWQGKRIGNVLNRGNGGPNEYHWLAGPYDIPPEIEEWVEAQDVEYDFERLDQIVDGLVCDFDDARRLKKLAKTKTVFRVRGDKEGAYRTLKKPYSESIQNHLDTKYGDSIIEIVGVTKEKR